MKVSKIVSALAPGALTLCLASGWSTAAHAALSNTTGAKLLVTPEYKEGELLVKFKKRDYRISSQAVEKSAPEVDSFESIHVPSGNSTFSSEEPWQIARLKRGSDTLRLKEQLARHPDVESVELNYRVSIAQIPNDPRFSDQWGLHNIGQIGGAFDADIDTPEAWDKTTGGSDVVVAVIDTGVDYTHEDLRANMWTNTGEIPANGIDDDGNGYVDDVHGYDFSNNDGDPADHDGHGTHVAGIIAAAGNNGVGISGISWSTKIMALKFIGPLGYGYTSDAIRAIRYAVSMGAQVTNNSWGGSDYSQALLDAIMEADAAGVLFVAAAHNHGRNSDLYPNYPSGFDAPNIVSVAATDQYDDKAPWSNYGTGSVDLAAPGVGILSTVPRGSCTWCDATGYSRMSGTSMAAPFVSGVAALLLSQNNMSPTELKDQLMSTVDLLASLGGLTNSGGRLNGNRAVRNDRNITPPGLPDLVLSNLTGPISVKAGEFINLTSRLANLRGQGTYSLTLFALSTDSTITWADYWLGCHYIRYLTPGSFANIASVFYIPANLTPGTYFIGGIVDFINLVEEHDESNNASVIQIEVLAP